MQVSILFLSIPRDPYTVGFADPYTVGIRKPIHRGFSGPIHHGFGGHIHRGYWKTHTLWVGPTYLHSCSSDVNLVLSPIWWFLQAILGRALAVSVVSNSMSYGDDTRVPSPAQRGIDLDTLESLPNIHLYIMSSVSIFSCPFTAPSIHAFTWHSPVYS